MSETPATLTTSDVNPNAESSNRINGQNSNSIAITPLNRIPYVHGGYAAAAPHFISQPKFASILKKLLPGAYAELSVLLCKAKRVPLNEVTSMMGSSCSPSNQTHVLQDDSFPSSGDDVASSALSLVDPVKVMKWAENNPVVSAFGICQSNSGVRTTGDGNTVTDHRYSASNDLNNNRLNNLYMDENDIREAHFQHSSCIREIGTQSMKSKSTSATSEVYRTYKKPALEWDVFLDPRLVRQVDAAIKVVEEFDGQLVRARSKRQKRLLSRLNNFGINNEEEEEEYDFDLLQSHTAAQIEVDRLVSQLMKRTVLAHGSMSQLILEAMGVAPDYNYKTVVKTSWENYNPRLSMKRGSTQVGRRGVPVDVTQLWDLEREQRDFECLLDPTMVGPEDFTMNTVKTSRCGSSKGIFVGTWLSIFSQTISLLKRGSDNGKLTTSSHYKSSQATRLPNNQTVKNIVTETQPAQIGQQGFAAILQRMFFTRSDSSFPHQETLSIIENDERDIELDECNINEEGSKDEHKSSSIQRYRNFSEEFDIAYDDMFSPSSASTSSISALCGISLCLGIDDLTPSFPLDQDVSYKMAKDIERITNILGEPLRLVLDLKSRRVPPLVWSRLIDSMRSRGLVVEGVGSFDMDELRMIGRSCCCPLTPFLFFHSVGDLQRACHANEINKGDTVYFNGGSLMWKRTGIMEAAENGCCGLAEANEDTVQCREKLDPSPRRSSKSGGKYSFQPYAYPRSSLSDWERVMVKSTLEDYKQYFNLKIGVYVQEFSISSEALEALSSFVNTNSGLYDQGLAFGGINGLAISQIHGDGYWNQRYMGRSWDFNARPSHGMTPLKPEDHHIVQKAIQAGAWGQVGTIYEVLGEQSGALTLPNGEPCNFVQPF